ncbi:MAG TPA: DUF2189 domain-containing protein [Azospira sp.]|nr:DUF2189 domain-containing protein [Azospira sp.]
MTPRKLHLASLSRALHTGWRTFAANRRASMAWALPFAAVAVLLWLILGQAEVAPMALAASGGFMLVGPLLLVGYFELADRAAQGENIRFAHALAAYRRAPASLWAMGAICTFFYLIWITDAATLYGFMVGGTPRGFATLAAPGADVKAFALWSSLMGAVLAFMIYAVTGFAVPLLHYRRAGLIQAVVLSVRTIFGNFLVALAWGLFLAGCIIASVLLLPLFPLAFPVLAYASHALYREALPDA